jgi:hypothetical protein
MWRLPRAWLKLSSGSGTSSGSEWHDAVWECRLEQYRTGDFLMLSPGRSLTTLVAAAALHGVAPPGVGAQQTAATVIAAQGPAVGDFAPDFTLRGGTRYGLLQTPVRLSDYRGSTVVLAFFYQARTKG